MFVIVKNLRQSKYLIGILIKLLVQSYVTIKNHLVDVYFFTIIKKKMDMEESFETASKMEEKRTELSIRKKIRYM